MTILKFSRFYNYSEALSMPDLAKGKGLYVWGIYSDKLGRIIPYYVGESNSSIIKRIHDHINGHMETYRVYNLNQIITKNNADELLYEIIYNITWVGGKNNKFCFTKPNFYNTLTPYQSKLFKKYTVYENNKEYIQFLYGVANFKKGDTQRKLISDYTLVTDRRKILEHFSTNWKIFFTRFRFSFIEIDDQVKDDTGTLERILHETLDKSTKDLKNKLVKPDSFSNQDDRTMFLGAINISKKYSEMYKFDLSKWKNNSQNVEQVTEHIKTDAKNCI